MEEIEDLFNRRQGIYTNHHSKLETDHLNAIEIADYIVDSLKLSLSFMILINNAYIRIYLHNTTFKMSIIQ